jgi:glycosyltransferase involved in cell wall biosynthesis
MDGLSNVENPVVVPSSQADRVRMKPRMQLLMISAYFDSHRGGIEIVVGHLAREFRRSGLNVAWLACDATAAPSNPDVCDRPIPIRAFNATERMLGIPFPIPGFTALATIRREVANADVVVLHDTLYPTNIAAYLLARWARKPVVVTQHIAAVPYRNLLLHSLMRLMNRLIARPILAGANQVVFISESTARAFADVKFRKPPRLIFNGVDTEIFHPAVDVADKIATRQHFGLPLDRPVALFVGRFVEKKGLNILRHAAQVDCDTAWAFAGWGALDPRSWGLPNVHVFSGLSEATLAPLYRASDAFVLPSIGEGFPLVLQEALASGLPAICSVETASADVKVTSLLHAIAIDNRDVNKTAAQLVQLVHAAINDNTPDLAARCFEQTCASYNWPRAAKQHLDLISEVASAHATTHGVAPPAWSRANR